MPCTGCIPVAEAILYQRSCGRCLRQGDGVRISMLECGNEGFTIDRLVKSYHSLLSLLSNIRVDKLTASCTWNPNYN